MLKARGIHASANNHKNQFVTVIRKKTLDSGVYCPEIKKEIIFPSDTERDEKFTVDCSSIGQ